MSSFRFDCQPCPQEVHTNKAAGSRRCTRVTYVDETEGTWGSDEADGSRTYGPYQDFGASGSLCVCWKRYKIRGGGTTKDPPRADDCRLDGACIIHGPSVPSHHGALLEDQDSGSGSVRVSRVGMPTSSLPAWAFHCACIQFHTGWPLRIAAGL